MLENIIRYDMEGAKINEDFKVISEVVLDMSTGIFRHYEKDMKLKENEQVVTTMYPSETKKVYYIENHEIDMNLAVTLGFGIIKNNADGKTFLYNMDTVHDEDDRDDELLKLEIYYQLTHPQVDNKNLEKLLNKKSGERYIRLLLFIDSEEPIQKLKEIYRSKKGKVLPFKNKLK